MKILNIRICGRISGAETYNITLLKEFKNYKNINFSFITNLKQFASIISPLVSKVICLPILGREIGTKKDLMVALLWLPAYWLLYLTNIRKLETQSRFDLICLQSINEKIFLTPVLRLFDYKIIWIEHGSLFKSETSLIIKWLYKKASTLSNKILAVSQNSKSDLVAEGIFDQKVDVIYIGVDTKKLRPCSWVKNKHTRDILHIDYKSKVIGFLGTVTREKGIEDFIDISLKLIRERDDFRFLIIGDGPDLHWMKRRINELNIYEYYCFVGFVENVKKYLDVINLLLLPTLRHEGISMAILESQSMGKIILTRDIGGNSEIIQNSNNGYLYKQWNNRKVSWDISNIFDNYKISTIIGKRARRNAIINFNIHKQVKQFYHLFLSI